MSRNRYVVSVAKQITFAASFIFVLNTAFAQSSMGGVESDEAAKPEITAGAKDGVIALPSRHIRLTIWDLMDRTDQHNELVSKREHLLMNGIAPFEIVSPIIDAMDTISGNGIILIRKGPLPHSRIAKGSDFKIMPGNPHRIAILPSVYPCQKIEYSGGAIGRQKALMKAQRRWREYKSGRDGLFLSNTWGDRARDSHLNESFMLEEIRLAEETGIEVVQIDDGWQRGRTSNSAASGGKGVWNGYWAADPKFWQPDEERFPNGLKPLVDAAKKRGIRIGLWFGPDSSNDAANWERDADLLLGYWRDYGISYFKIDSMKSTSHKAIANQRALFDKLIKTSNGEITCDLDVTAEIRPGYYGLSDVGPVFVENRYTDWVKYWPHQTLRNLWSLCEVVDPVRLRMEVLNVERNKAKYKDDPLAPANWKMDAVFASVMIASPLGWFEMSGLSRNAREDLKKIVPVWKKERDNIYNGTVYPVMSKPDGVSWTGFLVCADNSKNGYILAFREANECENCDLDIAGFFDGSCRQIEVLAGDGTAKCENNTAKITVNNKFGYIFAKVHQ